MSKRYKRHFIIPDTQVRPGVSDAHLAWAGRAIKHYKPDVIVHLGDHWDMSSLSSYDKPGSKTKEGKRVYRDIEAGNRAWELLEYHMGKQPKARKVFLHGNHEDRITRATEQDATLDGLISLKDLYTGDFEVYPFLKRVWIDGIVYAHYFQNQLSSYAIGGSIDNRLNRIGDSFVQGHEQGFRYGNRVYPTGKIRHGLVSGSYYTHDEGYKGPQGNDHWRGCVILNEVRAGDYCIMPLSLAYMKRTFGR